MVGKFIGISSTCRIALSSVQEGIVFTFYFNVNWEFSFFHIALCPVIYVYVFLYIFSLLMASISVKHAYFLK